MNGEKRNIISKAAAGLALAVAAFFAYSFLALSMPAMFNSPDENANHFFSVSFAEENKLYNVEGLNILLDDAVHPRSVKVVDGLQVPGGFLALPFLYGLIAKFVGTGSIGLITPLFAILGVLAWGFSMRRLFGDRVGLLAGLLLLANPAWWYWASRTMMPNVLFLSLLLMALCLFLVRPFASLIERRGIDGFLLLRHSDYALAGIAAGLALAVRPVELYWLILIDAALLLTVRKYIPWKGAIVTAVFMLLTLVPFGFLNNSVYGSFLSTGYGDVAATVSDDAHQGMGARLLGPVRPLLFPLGFAPRTAVSNFWSFGLKLFWGWTLLVGASALYLLRTSRQRRTARLSDPAKGMLAVSVVVVAWLMLFYGSYVLSDNSVAGAVTIGVSYTRYWLPIFILSTLPVAFAASRLFETYADRKWTKPLAKISVLIYFTLSAAMVFGAPQEGLNSVRDTLEENSLKLHVIFDYTEPDSIIVTDRADKFIFPHRRVIQPLRSERTYSLLRAAVDARPTYYYGLTLPERDLMYLATEKLPPLGVNIEPMVSVDGETLYRIVRWDGDVSAE
jgi:hypothetical protein